MVQVSQSSIKEQKVVSDTLLCDFHIEVINTERETWDISV